MNQNNALLKGAGSLATIVAAMVATSRRGVELVAEQPAVEREGMKSINYKIAAGLVAAGLGCGGSEVHHHYYGPNGEEIISSGNCDFKGKYLFTSECNLVMAQPVGDDCRMELIGNQGNANYKVPGILEGRVFHFISVKEGRDKGKAKSVTFLRPGEFDINDVDVSAYVPESQMKMGEEFMCYFRNDPTFLAARYNQDSIKASIENIWGLSDKPSGRDCVPIQLRPWFRSCC
ncbi:MAG TPA: hypothetical protein VJA18_01895 [Candidatus Nanoarchaeia archaeon]|nr:hypothetical protein [Candidatus Nanoarchaeia archaeon]